MIGWLIYNLEDVEKNSRYIQFYIEEGKKLGIDIELRFADYIQFGIREGKHFLLYNNESVWFPDFCVVRCIYPLLTKQLEYLGIPVFNNSFVSEICNDKAKTYQYVASLGIKMVDSYFYKNNYLNSLKELPFKETVIKSVSGHGGNEVFLLTKFEELDGVLKQCNNKDMVVQPLTGSRREDLRVYVLGDKILAAILRKAKDGFKSNFSLGGEVVEYQLGEEEISIVKKIIGIFDFSLVGIDFIIGDAGELIFNEIEDVVGARMLYQCTDINLVYEYLSFIKNKVTKAIESGEW